MIGKNWPTRGGGNGGKSPRTPMHMHCIMNNLDILHYMKQKNLVSTLISAQTQFDIALCFYEMHVDFLNLQS